MPLHARRECSLGLGWGGCPQPQARPWPQGVSKCESEGEEEQEEPRRLHRGRGGIDLWEGRKRAPRAAGVLMKPLPCLILGGVTVGCGGEGYTTRAGQAGGRAEHKQREKTRSDSTSTTSAPQPNVVSPGHIERARTHFDRAEPVFVTFEGGETRARDGGKKEKTDGKIACRQLCWNRIHRSVRSVRMRFRHPD